MHRGFQFADSVTLVGSIAASCTWPGLPLGADATTSELHCTRLVAPLFADAAQHSVQAVDTKQTPALWPWPCWCSDHIDHIANLRPCCKPIARSTLLHGHADQAVVLDKSFIPPKACCAGGSESQRPGLLQLAHSCPSECSWQHIHQHLMNGTRVSKHASSGMHLHTVSAFAVFSAMHSQKDRIHCITNCTDMESSAAACCSQRHHTRSHKFCQI